MLITNALVFPLGNGLMLSFKIQQTPESNMYLFVVKLHFAIVYIFLSSN